MRNDFLQSALRVKDVGVHTKEIARSAKSDPHDLVELFMEITAWKQQPIPWQMDSIRNAVIQSLCHTKGKNQIHCLLEILPLITDEKKLYSIANMLTFSQDHRLLTDAILSVSGQLSEHFILLLSHELITHGCDLRIFDDYHHLVDNLNKNSPFKGLTLYPLEIETSLPQIHYGAIGTKSWEHTFDSNSHDEVASFAQNFDSTEIEYWKKNDEITKFIKHWSEDSNGTIIGVKGRCKHIESAVGLLHQLVRLLLRVQL